LRSLDAGLEGPLFHGAFEVHFSRLCFSELFGRVASLLCLQRRVTMLPMRFVSNSRDVSAFPTGLGSILSSPNAGLKGPLFHGTSRPPSIEKSQHCRNAIFRQKNRNLFATGDALDNPVEERPFQGRVAGTNQNRPLGPVYRFGILHRRL
jgi:hypothetical protein